MKTIFKLVICAVLIILAAILYGLVMGPAKDSKIPAPTDSDYLTYLNKTYSYEFVYPKSWEISKPEEKDPNVANMEDYIWLNSPTHKDGDQFTLTFESIVIPPPGTTHFEDARMEAFSKKGLAGFIDNAEEIKLNGAMTVRGTMSFDDPSGHRTVNVVALGGDGALLLVTWPQNLSADDEAAVTKIIESVKFNDAAAEAMMPENVGTFTYGSNFKQLLSPKDDDEINSLGFIPLCYTQNLVECLKYDTSKYNGSNIEGAAISLNKDVDHVNSRVCMTPPPSDMPSSMTTINGVKFLTYQAGGVATGHSTMSTIYKTLYKDACYTISTGIDTSRYDKTEGIFTREFTGADEKTVQSELDAVVRTFVFSN